MKYSGILHRCEFCEHFTTDGIDGYGTCQIAKKEHPEIVHPDFFYGIGDCVFPVKFEGKEMEN